LNSDEIPRVKIPVKKPEGDENASKVEETIDLSNTFTVEEYEILLQYVAGTAPMVTYNKEKVIKDDLRQLCQLYLEA
jgi:hypothetical protein